MANNLRNSFIILISLLLLSACVEKQTASQVPEYPQGSVVAVWGLDDLSVVVNDTLAEMSDFLTAEVASTLNEKGNYRIVEREKLLIALEELHLGNSGLVDEQSRLRIGQVLGVQVMVFGGYQVIGEQMRIDLRMVAVETGAVVSTASKVSGAADVSGWLKTAEEAAMELL